MKEINQYKKVINLFYKVALVGFLTLYPIKGLFAIMEEDISYLGISNVTQYTVFWSWAIFTIKYLSIIAFFLGIYYLLKTLNIKSIQEIFDDKNRALFLKSGKTFQIAALIGSLTIWVDVFNGSFGSLKLGNDFLLIIYLQFILSFFLIIFSKVLHAAKEIKQENDLTI